MRIYCDTSALGVEFNDQQTQENAREASAMRIVLAIAAFKNWQLIDATPIHWEAKASGSSRIQRTIRVKLKNADQFVRSVDVSKRASELEALGFETLDSRHLACALAANADVLLTCDGEFHDLGRQNAKIIALRILRPSEFLAEVDYGKE
ncbi:hypothetical protein BAC2_02249 [uncultured bacterium]|nr:hypothetical protein BAC2_02249 [uncultured bacterium]